MAKTSKDSRFDELEGVINQINRSAKRTVIASANNVPYLYGLRRPSGIMQLDIDTGGGLPGGSVCCISGPDGAGKTDLLYRYYAWQQRIHREKACIVHAQVEHQVDHFRMRRAGIKVPVPKDAIDQEQSNRKALGFPLLTKAEILDLSTGMGFFHIIAPDDMESTFDRVLKLLEKGPDLIQMIGVDSVSAMIPRDIMNKDLDEEAKRGAHAMCLKKFFLKLYSMGGFDNPMWTTIVFTQQVTSNDAKSAAPSYIAKYMPDFAVKGGYAGKHGKIIDILLTNGAKKKEKGDDDKKVVTGKTVQWELIKGKAGTHEGIRGEVDFDFNSPEHIDYARTVFVAGLKCGVLAEQQGLVTWMHNGQPHPECQRIPFEEFMQAIKLDAQFDLSLRRAILWANGIRDVRYA